MINQYNPVKDLEIKSQHLASLLYILGYENADFQNLTIDDVINLIRSRYVYKHSGASDLGFQEYIKKQNIVLSRSVRRAWFDVQFATHEVKNAH